MVDFSLRAKLSKDEFRMLMKALVRIAQSVIPLLIVLLGR